MTSPQNKRPHRRIGRVLLILLAAIALALMIVAGVYTWLYYQGRQSLHTSGGSISTHSGAVEQEDDLILYNGKRYRYNEHATPILVMGIDKKDIQQDDIFGANGQADALFLMVPNTDTGDIHMILLSRDTMVDVDMYSADGSYSGVQKTQLCLAYAYASDGDAACRNVARSVSRVLYGVPIDKYVAIDLAGVKALTGAVDGVSVTALESMDLAGRWVKEGQTLTLWEDQAVAYIQERDDDPEANLRRMARQKQFFTSFIGKAGDLLQKNPGRLPGLYNTAKPYMVSNITLPELTFLAGRTLENGGWKNIHYHSVTGETVLGEKHVEFYADTTSAYEAVLAAFYTEVTD